MSVMITIGGCMFCTGFVGLILNVITGADVHKLKHHTYSSLPAIAGLIVMAIAAIVKASL